jgi:hypothetical protein
MKNQKIISILMLAITLTLISCDPAKRIVITNKTGQNATIEFRPKPNLQINYLGKSSKETTFFSLGFTKKDNFKGIYFGLGAWGKHPEIIDLIESIEIKTFKSTEIFKGDEQVKLFFESRVKGLLKEKIVIKIK